MAECCVLYLLLGGAPTCVPWRAAQIIVKGSSSRQPADFSGVYAALDAIIARADGDPRDFAGFKRDWSPNKVPPPPRGATSHRHRGKILEAPVAASPGPLFAQCCSAHPCRHADTRASRR